MIPPLVVRIVDPRLNLAGLEVFTSLEGENPGGSMKDHMVKGELTDLRRRGALPAGARVSEVSAGSTALSLAVWCPHFGVGCDLFVPVGTDPEKLERLRSEGASLHLAPFETIYQDHDLFQKKNGTHAFNQLWDEGKSKHYVTLGERIRDEFGPFDAVLGAVGTGHSLKGLGRGLQTKLVLSAEPEAPLRIPGIRNLDGERYGEKDPCRAENFSKRLFVNSSELFPERRILSDHGPIWIGNSFQLVLAALLKSVKALPRRVFLVAADSRRC